ncbi:MAG TPA: amidohydrolase family protein [bacterium]|nr:amidohydrolase family protein [bacterium]
MQGQPLEHARAKGFASPPPRKIRGPIVDVHTHTTEPATNHELIEAARLYGITTLVAIAPLDVGRAIQNRYPKEIVLAVRPILNEPNGQIALLDRAVETVHQARALGAPLIKFWFAPRIRDRLDFLLDSPRLDPVFRAIDEEGLGVLVHVSDPDRWFKHKYDPAKYGTKADQYPMLETRLRQFPRIPFLAAHMGGDPEHLDHLADLLTRYPNLYLDTSATKWIVRELGRQREAARTFFHRWADRICFGTDQVVLKESDPTRYLVRYWVHQMFWETDLQCPSPIPDPDSDGPPSLRGLDLPEGVLGEIYSKTAERAFGIQARRPEGAQTHSTTKTASE